MASKKIGALWLRKTGSGKKYFSGVLEDLRGTIQIAVFENDRKEKENQPDFNIVLSGDRDEEQTAKKRPARSAFDDFGTDEPNDGSDGRATQKELDGMDTIEYPEEDINPDDIPF